MADKITLTRKTGREKGYRGKAHFSVRPDASQAVRSATVHSKLNFNRSWSSMGHEFWSNFENVLGCQAPGLCREALGKRSYGVVFSFLFKFPPCNAWQGVLYAEREEKQTQRRESGELDPRKKALALADI